MATYQNNFQGHSANKSSYHHHNHNYLSFNHVYNKPINAIQLENCTYFRMFMIFVTTNNILNVVKSFFLPPPNFVNIQNSVCKNNWLHNKKISKHNFNWIHRPKKKYI